MYPKILFVDDDEKLLSSFRRFFRKNFDVTTCINGKIALEKLLETQEYSVIIADYKMPEVDGLQLLAEARKISPKTVRIMLTGEANLETAVRGVNECDLFRFLIKPFPSNKMLTVINDAVKQHKINEIVFDKVDDGAFSNVLSVCSYCHNIRDPELDPYQAKNWEKFEIFLKKKFGITFSHGICPDCVPKFMEEMNEED